MLFEFGLHSVALLIFFIHGLLFSVMLLYKRIESGHVPSGWLGLLILLGCMYVAPFMLGYAGWYSRLPYRDIMFYIPFQQNFLIPPVLYFYFRSLLDSSFRFSRKGWLHFIPAFAYLLYSVVIFAVDKLVLHDYYFYADGQDKDLSTWYQVAGLISLCIYLVASLDMYRRYKHISYATLSFADGVMFNWAKRFLIAFLILVVIRSLLFVLHPEWDSFGKKFWYYLGFSILFYYVSVSGYINAIHSHTSLKEEDNTNEERIEDKNIIEDEEDAVLPDLATWKEKVENAMTGERIFENAELTLSDLGAHLQVHTKKLSAVINQGFGLNFNDLVNHYRTKSVIRMIEKGEHTTQTLLGIAFSCGFNSKSTFNRAFKKHTGLTPKEYVAKLEG